MDLMQLRKSIDDIDNQLVSLFAGRMELASQIAACKKERGLPVLDEKREREKLAQIAALCPEQYRDYAAQLYTKIFELSRSYQQTLL